MLSAGVVYLVMFATVLAVAIYAIIISRSMDVTNLKNFLSAKNSQSAFRLGWCFFASGMGSWTLYSFPEIGVLAGTWGVIGYTLSGCIGMIVLAFVGPFTRKLLGDGMTLTDYVNNRFGKGMQLIIATISVFYQFISLVSELTVVGGLAQVLAPDVHPWIPIVLIAFVTNVYLLIGGLRASMATDVWQSIGVVSLLLVVCAAMAFHVKVPENAWSESNIAAFTSTGFETLVTLCIAITASNLFYTGFWQRVYAARDDKTLMLACVFTCCLIIPFTVALAISGMVSALAYPDGLYFFSILLDMGRGWQIAVAIVIASLATSVTDSIQLGMAGELVGNFPSLSLLHARIICVGITIPAIFIAIRNYNILRLFLIADLLCTAAVGPMLLGAWHKASTVGALAGCGAGLLTIFVTGVIAQGSFWGGFEWFVLPDGLYAASSMITFIVTLIIPILTTIVVSLWISPRTDVHRDNKGGDIQDSYQPLA